MIVLEHRAAVILYNVLRSLADPRPFLLPANVCAVVPETFRAAGQSFEFVDIAEPHLGMSLDQCVSRAREKDIAGVVHVRTYGNELDPSLFFASLRQVREDVFLIDDKCLCRPDVDGTALSPLADVTLFSTGRVKYADIGYGGFAHLAGSVAYRRFDAGPLSLSSSETPPDWDQYRTSVIEAAIAADVWKRQLNTVYESGIPVAVQLPPALQRWRFSIRVPEPDRLVETIFANGLFASRHYPAMAGCPVATQLHAEVVNLFNDRHFDTERAQQVTELVSRHLGTSR